MIKRAIAGFIFLSCISAEAQVLRDINYSYLYDPGADFTFNWKVVRTSEGIQSFHEFHATDTSRKINPTLQFETRSSISEKNGLLLKSFSSWQDVKGFGSFTFNPEPNQTILVARITLTIEGKSKIYFFHKPLPQTISIYLASNNIGIIHPYTRVRESVTFTGFDPSKPLIISHYDDIFPAAAPPFATAQARVPKTIKPDSIFSVSSTSEIRFERKGLYLAQVDTSSAEGLAFRVEEDYPKLGTIQSLAAPLIYICTKSETEKLKQVGNDKKKFDQIILTITGNQDRAKIFIRSYFKRVELANQYFSSYKEGWKTDRGMMYIIYGPPEEVYLFEDREVWEYKINDEKIRFQFVRSRTLFDPDNYVLVRDKNFNTNYYERVDLWRKARF